MLDIFGTYLYFKHFLPPSLPSPFPPSAQLPLPFTSSHPPFPSLPLTPSTFASLPSRTLPPSYPRKEKRRKNAVVYCYGNYPERKEAVGAQSRKSETRTSARASRGPCCVESLRAVVGVTHYLILFLGDGNRSARVSWSV